MLISNRLNTDGVLCSVFCFFALANSALNMNHTSKCMVNCPLYFPITVLAVFAISGNILTDLLDINTSN
jgi:hypothetical protein